MYVSCTAYSQPGCRPVQNRHGNIRHQCASADIFILHFEPRSCVSCTVYRQYINRVEEDTPVSGLAICGWAQRFLSAGTSVVV
jgi:hypothetical protein